MKKKILLTLFTSISLFTTFSRAQNITTFAGTGISGYSGDGGPATAADIGQTLGVGVDTAGNVYIPDSYNHVIRKVSTSGVITTIIGTGTAGHSGDGGPATAAELNEPTNVAFDRFGNMYIVEHHNNDVRKVSTTGIITTIAGNGTHGYSGDGGPATDAQFHYPWGITVDNTGNVYLVDGGNNVIRKINTAGIITNFAGTGASGYNGDNIAATAAQLNNPVGIVTDGHNNFYFTDNQNNRIRKIDSMGIITTVAGDGIAGYSGDGGAATSAQISGPLAIARDPSGKLYFSDYSNNVVRKITSTVISTFAGNGINGFAGDGGSALLAEFNNLWGVTIDKNYHLYIGDVGNIRVRKITIPSTEVSGLADEANEITIYPNPAQTQLIITSAKKINHITITNIAGEVVYTREYNNEKVLVNIADFPAGLYFAQLNGLYIRNFVKQ